MSASKEYRELQFSSTQLVAVFLGVLAAGIIIFILGVSVGKKQGRLAAAAGVAAPAKTEVLSEKKPAAVPETTTSAPSVQTPEKATPETKIAAPPATKPAEPVALKPATDQPAGAKTKAAPAPAPAATGTYFVQIGAVDDKAAATALAGRVGKEGFPALVVDPRATDKKTIFRIRLGPYATKEDAEDARTKAAAALKKKKTDFFVVKG